jgi:hypothetical protein
LSTECSSGELPRCILTTWGHSVILLEREFRYVQRIPSVRQIEVVIELLIQSSLLGIEFRLASLFGLVCGGPRQELRCPRLHLYYRRIVQYGSSRVDQRIGKNLLQPQISAPLTHAAMVVCMPSFLSSRDFAPDWLNVSERQQKNRMPRRLWNPLRSRRTGGRSRSAT